MSSALYATLRRDILLAPSAPPPKLNIDALCRRYDATSTPVREALNQLTSEGFVRRREQRGFFVAEASHTEPTGADKHALLGGADRAARGDRPPVLPPGKNTLCWPLSPVARQPFQHRRPLHREHGMGCRASRISFGADRCLPVAPASRILHAAVDHATRYRNFAHVRRLPHARCDRGASRADGGDDQRRHARRGHAADRTLSPHVADHRNGLPRHRRRGGRGGA